MFITSAYVSFTVQWRERSGACGEPVADLTGKSQGQRGPKLLITQEKTETEGLKKNCEKKKNLLSWNSNNNTITFYTGSAAGVRGWANCSFRTLPTWPAQLRQINEGWFSSTTKRGMVTRNRKVQVQCWLKIYFLVRYVSICWSQISVLHETEATSGEARWGGSLCW